MILPLFRLQKLRAGAGVLAVCALLWAGGRPCAAATGAGAARWTGTWAAAPYAERPGPATPDFGNMTLRQVVHTSLAGSALRIRVTNEFGTEPLRVSAAHVAMSAGGGAIEPGTDHAATFNGETAIKIPPGAYVLSDPIAMPVGALSDVAISLYLPAQQISVATFHGDSDATSYLAAGDQSGTAALDGAKTVNSWYFIKGVDVEATARGAGAVVAFGDSITDGAYATLNANHRWPDFLAQRLLANRGTENLAVLNEGIGGNRVLRDDTGPSALARFDRDVLSQAAVRYVIVLESINDIGRLARRNDPIDAVTAQDLEQGLAQMVARAHEHGIKVFGATLTPYQGANYYTDAGEQIREAVNQWIRTSGVFDGVVDFEKAVENPADPKRYLLADEHGDHLHPNDAGYRVMGDAVDLGLFR